MVRNVGRSIQVIPLSLLVRSLPLLSLSPLPISLHDANEIESNLVTNIPAAILGGLFQTLFISDSARTIVHAAPPPTLRVLSRGVPGGYNPNAYGNNGNGTDSVAPTFSTEGMTHSDVVSGKAHM